MILSAPVRFGMPGIYHNWGSYNPQSGGGGGDIYRPPLRIKTPEQEQQERQQYLELCEKRDAPFRQLLQEHFSNDKAPEDPSMLHQALQNWNWCSSPASIDISGLLPSVSFWTFGKARKQRQQQRDDMRQTLKSVLEPLAKDLCKVFALFSKGHCANQLKLIFHNNRHFTVATYRADESESRAPYGILTLWRGIRVDIESTPDPVQALTKATHQVMRMLVQGQLNLKERGCPIKRNLSEHQNGLSR